MKQLGYLELARGRAAQRIGHPSESDHLRTSVRLDPCTPMSADLLLNQARIQLYS
jgi:hypothetical protein